MTGGIVSLFLSMKRIINVGILMGILQLGLLLLVACTASGNQLSPDDGSTPAAEATAAAATATPTATAPGPAAAGTLAATPAPQTHAITPAVTTVSVTVEVTRPPVGTAGRPVQLLFPPVAPGAVIMQRAEPLAEALRAATGAEFAVGVVDSEAALVELLCTAPEDVIGFLSAAAYTIAHDECDAQPGLVAVGDDGLTWQMGMLAIRPGAAAELADLAGKRWAVADTHSLPNYLYFLARMAAAGVEPGEIVSAPEESSALLALYDGEVDFSTASFVPPIMPNDRRWIAGETEPEEWRLLGIPPSRSPIGYVLVAGEPEFGGYRLRDARARMFDTTPEIFNATRILALSEPIPNDTIVFGANFPLGVARQALATMTGFAASDACATSICSADLFGWAGLQPAEDTAYDPIRAIKDTLELEAADLFAELD